MQINSSNSIKTHLNDIDTLKKDAENNGINLAATPQQPIEFQDTMITIADTSKIAVSEPQSLISMIVQWFNRVILQRTASEADLGNDDLSSPNVDEISLEKPIPISQEMVDVLAKDFEALFIKTQNVDKEVEDLFQGHSEPVDQLYNILAKMMMQHYKARADERKVKSEQVLFQHDELKELQHQRAEMKGELTTMQERQQFWSRVNTGCSAAATLVTVAGLAASIMTGAMPVALMTLQITAMLSSGASQIANAGIKKSNQTLSGEFVALNNEQRTTDDRIQRSMELLSGSHQALTKVIKDLTQLNQKQHQLIMSLTTDMRNTR